MAELFQRIEDRKEDYIVEVTVTFLEIYNEEIRDLLSEPGTHVPRGGLAIREDRTVKVVGLTELKPGSAEEVKEIVLLGNTRRTQSPTLANATSSRSHAVLQVQVTQSPRTAAITEQKTVATLSIIDLAGSERAAATTNMGQRMIEGANINKSLLALGNCINALCESGGATRHVPYRNSKLTRLLKFSLGGNCKTVMIVCVAPTSLHFDDTHNTLVYAERATKIKTKIVTRNVLNVDRHVGRYVEAINRLNDEIKELKEKLAGKRKSEKDVEDRKKAAAREEVERAKSDLNAKVQHTRTSIADGGACMGKIAMAKLKLQIIRNRLAKLELEGASAAVSAERALLQALAGPEEDALKPSSPLGVRLQRASNSTAMFDATMRAVAERKSDKLDEFSADNVKAQAASRQAEMETARLTSERDAFRDAAEDMADVMVKLIGMLGRCTVIVGDSATKLQAQDSTEVKEVALMLNRLREKNDESFKTLLGHSTEAYTTLGEAPTNSFGDPFLAYGTTFAQRRVSSGPAVLQQPEPAKHSRRGSLAPASPPRRSLRSPRKSLRGSAGMPYTRRPSAEMKEKKPVKSVQWRDEAGRGDLDDGGNNPVAAPPPPMLSIIPASPGESVGSTSINTHSPVIRPGSALGSESEWEDDEKTDDSVNIAKLPSLTTSLSASTSSRPSTSGRRPRASRLDPNFLKTKSKASSTLLGSVSEADESMSQDRPLNDVINQMNEDSSSSAENEIIVPKAKDRHLGSPSKRMPSSLKGPSLSASTSKAPGPRRRSNVGPVRGEKTGRRRSSMIPQLSPTQTEGNTSKAGSARRVLIASPAKRTKRSSLTRSVTGEGRGSVRLKPIPALGLTPASSSLTLSLGDFSTEDISVGKIRPTWR
jgi:kinesin family protein 18/19